MAISAANAQRAISLLRIAAALFMVAHGVARIWFRIVDDFGVFLSNQGFPQGFYLAWAITIFEIAGGLALAAGYFTLPLSLVFIAELIVGIVLVHAASGWFVVGAGKNGAEFSVLLILIFAAVAYSNLDDFKKIAKKSRSKR